MLLHILELEVIFILELFKYIFAYRLSVKKTVKNILGLFIAASISSVVLNILFLNKMQIADAYVCLLLLAVVLVFLFVRDKYSEKIWKAIIIFLNVTAIDSVMDRISRKIYCFFILSETKRTIVWDIMSLGFIVFALFLSYLIEKKEIGRKKDISKKTVQFSVVLADICLCICSTFMLDDTSGDNTYFVIGMLSFFGVFLLGVQMIKIFDLNNTLIEVVEQKNQMNEMQKVFYQNIINNEEEIRKYRHDMINHFMVITNYLKKNKIDEAKEYIDKMYNLFIATSRTKYATGNEIVDAISCYYISSVDSFVEVSLEGTLHDEIGIEDINLCTIYSNLLKNAVEELQRQKDNGEKNLKLNIVFKMGRDFLKISMVNSASANNNFIGVNTPTSKKDKKNHGIGLANVMRALDREQGKIALSNKCETVCADVVIPIKKK